MTLRQEFKPASLLSLALVLTCFGCTYSASTQPVRNPTTKNSEVTKDVNDRLSDMDRLELTTLEVLFEQIQAISDQSQFKQSCADFLVRSDAFIQAHPNANRVWLYRAAVALESNDVEAGVFAAYELKSAGALKSSDKSVQKLMLLLNIRQWIPHDDTTDPSASIAPYWMSVVLKGGLGGVPRDDDAAFQWLKSAADLGHSGANWELFLNYFPNDVTEQNGTTALNYLKRASDLGNSQAMNTLAGWYESGWSWRGGSTPGDAPPDASLDQDIAKALDWYRKAANAGNDQAMFRLGKAYENGELGLNADAAASHNWYQRAADAGNADAKLKIAPPQN